jgi:hypothetical protein
VANAPSVPLQGRADALAPDERRWWWTVAGAGLALSLAYGLVPERYVVLREFVSVGMSVILTIAAIAVDELNYRTYRTRGDVLRLTWYALIEGFGYRPLNEIWRALGFVDIARRKKAWGAQQRRGFAGVPE